MSGELNLFTAKTEHEIKQCLDRGDDINIQTYGSICETPFAYHCKNNNIEAAVGLVKYGCDVTLHTFLNMTGLNYVCENGNSVLLIALLQSEIIRNIINNVDRYYTPLILACKNGHTDIFDILIQYGADPNLENTHKITPLMEACDKNHIDIVDRLLSLRIDINARNDTKNTVLYMCKSVEILDKLYSYGIDINIQNKYRQTALIYFIETRSNIELIKALIDYKANLDIVDNYGRTAIIYCTIYDQLDETLNEAEEYRLYKYYTAIIKLLLEAGANKNIIDNNGNSAYDYAETYSNYLDDEEMVNLFL